MLPAAISEGRSLKAQLTGMLGTKMNRRKLTRRTITLNVTCPWLLLVFRLLCGSCCEETVFVLVCVKNDILYDTQHVIMFIRVPAYSVKTCNADGTWFRHPETGRVWTNYTMCYDHALVEVAITCATTMPT